MPTPVVERVEVDPVWPVRLPPAGVDGTGRRGEDGAVERLVLRDGAPVVLRAQARPDGRVVLTATAPDAAAAAWGLERARFWTAVDDDLAAFCARFADDPVIGPSVTAAPWVRPFRRPVPFEALAWAVCEQLITDERSQGIKRAIVRRFGPRDPASGLMTVPGPGAVAGLAPAELQACDLAAGRARALIAAAREVAAGRAPLETADPAERERAWRRLRAIPGIGAWTLSALALHGQGVHDALPAGDTAFRSRVGALLRLGRGATEAEVVDVFAPYAPWRGVAAWHLLRVVP